MQTLFLALHVLAFTGVAVSPLTQEVLVVDKNGGPGTDFTTIGAAVAAASGGELILIRSGRYTEDVIVTSKTLTLQEDRRADVRITSIEIRNLGSTDFVSVRGVWAESLQCRNAQGAIWLEDVTLLELGPPLTGGPGYMAYVEHCDSVVLKDCQIVATSDTVPTDPLRVSSSSVYVYGSNVRGWDGQWEGACGSSGISVSNSLLYVEGSSVRGGDTYDVCNAFAGCTRAGDGIVAGFSAEVVVKDSSVLSGGAAGVGCQSGDDFRLVDPASTLTVLSGSRRSLSVPSPRAERETTPLTYTGVQDDVVFLLVSSEPWPATVAPGLTNVYQHVVSSYTIPLGTAPASGILARELGPFDIALASRSFFAQACYTNGAEAGLSSPTQLHVLDGAFRLLRQPDPPVVSVERSF